MASALPTPSVSECSESLEPSRVDKDQEDFPIISLNELTPNDCATVLEQQEIESYLEKPFEYKQLHSIESYHLDQVQHYLEIVMRITDPSIVPPEVLQALPDVYVKYIQDIREAVYVD